MDQNYNNGQPGQQPNFNQPYQPYQPPQPQESKGMAIASLIMGILSVVCCGSGLFGILGLVFGIQGKKKAPSAQGMCTAGIVLSIIGLVLCVIFIILNLTGALAGFWASMSY